MVRVTGFVKKPGPLNLVSRAILFPSVENDWAKAAVRSALGIWVRELYWILGRIGSLIGAFFAVFGLSGPAVVTADTAEVTVLPLFVHVAQQGGRAVADEAWFDAHLSHANEVFAQYGIRFEVVAREPYVGRAVMDTRDDRSSLRDGVEQGVINCFVVASLRDVDDPSRMRQGVHWHAPNKNHYVILSSAAQSFVLAHELGHFLGNPRHSDTPGNLMSYERRPTLPFLDKPQLRRLHRRLARYLREGELKAR